MLEAQQQEGEQDAAAQQEEGGHELLEGQGFARGLLLLVGLAGAREPEPGDPLEVPCGRIGSEKCWGEIAERQGSSAHPANTPHIGPSSTWPTEQQPFASLTVLSVLHDLLVEHLQVLGLPGEGDAVAGQRVPGAHGQQAALVVLPHQVLQHRGVVEEGVQLPGGGEGQRCYSIPQDTFFFMVLNTHTHMQHTHIHLLTYMCIYVYIDRCTGNDIVSCHFA